MPKPGKSMRIICCARLVWRIASRIELVYSRSPARPSVFGSVATNCFSEQRLRSIFVESQCVIDREVRGLQQKSLGQTNGFTDSEYEILVDIALGLTDRAIARRRGLSLRSVQNRLQQLYDKLDVYQAASDDNDDGRFNLRARAITVAFLRKLLNYSALERAEAELQEWLDGK